MLADLIENEIGYSIKEPIDLDQRVARDVKRLGLIRTIPRNRRKKPERRLLATYNVVVAMTLPPRKPVNKLSTCNRQR
jgi:hypothetical protein